MKAYKAFDKNMQCLGFQYEVGKTYTEDSANLCVCGFHACEDPFDVFNYYSLCTSRFAEVELSDTTEQHDYDSKRVGKIITIIRELSLFDYIATAVKVLCETCKTIADDETQFVVQGYDAKFAIHNDKNKAVSSGYGSKLATAGDRNKLVASGDYSQLAASGDYAQLIASGTGVQLAASGYGSKLIASGSDVKLAASGDCSQIAAFGDKVQLTSSGYGIKLMAVSNKAQLAASGGKAQLAADGYNNKLTVSGDNAQIVSSGDNAQLLASGYGSQINAVGNNNVIMLAGQNGKAKAQKGSWIVLTEWGKNDKNEYGPLHVVTKQVDDENIKSDTWYKLIDGEFVETEE